MSAQDLVNRLDFCKPTGKDQWMARCPAHDDRGPSLSIKDAGDGRTLVHCFAGCGAVDVLAAIGFELSDLYPPTDRNYHSERQLKERSIDELVVEIAMADMRAGKELSDEDMERCTDALKRLDGGKKSPDIEREHVERNAVTVAKRESLRIKKVMGEWM